MASCRIRIHHIEIFRILYQIIDVKLKIYFVKNQQSFTFEVVVIKACLCPRECPAHKASNFGVWLLQDILIQTKLIPTGQCGSFNNTANMKKGWNNG
jgi:hypothetical protein